MSFRPPLRFLDKGKPNEEAEAKKRQKESESRQRSEDLEAKRQRQREDAIRHFKDSDIEEQTDDSEAIELTEDSETERRLASYYLKEEYDTSGSSSSNREEVEHAVRKLSGTVEKLEAAIPIFQGQPIAVDAARTAESSLECTQDDDPFEFRTHHVKTLLRKALSTHYNAAHEDEDDEIIFYRCVNLLQKDLILEFLENPGGSLSWNYPRKMIIPICEKHNYTQVFFRNNFEKYCLLSKQAAIARCRNRFPVPVMIINGKFICRSATLSVRKSAAYGIVSQGDAPPTKDEDGSSEVWSGIKNVAKSGVQPIIKFYNALKLLLATPMDEVKDLDVRILKYLRVCYICDLMVENRKMHTGLSVGSSEKINMKHYGLFKTIRMPYPGISFFAQYSLSGRNGRGLVYHWNVPVENKSPLKMVNDLPQQCVEQPLPAIKKNGVPIDWEEYESWDLYTLTKNYLRILIHYAVKPACFGMLIHCVSGWDRTALFVSLLRISLWADCCIHTQLTPKEMAYLTIAYDWYLFGHDLPSKVKKREEMFHFCFNFLEELISEEYSIRSYLSMLEERKARLLDLKKIVLDIYENEVRLR